MNLEKIISVFINKMFEKYTVFGGEYDDINSKEQYVEGIIKRLKLDIHFHSK